MSKPRPIPTADQPWFGPDGKPRVYDYLFDLDRAARKSYDPVVVVWSDIEDKPSSFPPSAHGHEQSDIVGLAPSLAGKQPLNSNLTDISGLTTTPYGRGLLTQADALSLRGVAGLIIGTDVAPQSHVGAGGAAHANAVASGAAGFMTGADKAKLDGVSSGADVTAASFGAWTAYTPTVSAGSGSFTSVSSNGAYRQIGKTVFVRLGVIITTNGTAASYINATLPVAGKSGVNQVLFGSETYSTAKSMQGGIVGNIVRIRDAVDLSYPGANGRGIFLNGVYEAD